MELRGTTALVTGGAHRLGRAIALGLAEAGANVAVTYHASAIAAADTVRAIRARAVDGLALPLDASDDRQVARAVRAVVRRFGRIDLWVANAGVFRRTPLASIAERDWDEVMRLNFQVLLVPARRIGTLMQRQGRGCIVALADVAALRPWAEYIPYSVAKRCVVSLTVELAAALAPAVRVNAIAPGPVLFPDAYAAAAQRREIARTALGRQGDPRHIAEAVRFLATNDYVTGTVLPIDGGRLLA